MADSWVRYITWKLPCTLDIIFPLEMPRITFISSEKVRIKDEGESIHETFTCTAQGSPNLAIAWYHNRVRISNSQKYQIIPTVGQDNLTSTLRLTNINSTDNGVMMCTASINGCSQTHSYSDCYSQVLNDTSRTTLSILSR